MNKKLFYTMSTIMLLLLIALTVVSVQLHRRSSDLHHIETTGDVNNDGKVNLLDLSILAAHYEGARPKTNINELR